MVEIIPKQDTKRPAWNNVILVIAVVFLLVSVGGVLGLRQLNLNTKKIIEGLDLELSQGKTEEQSQLENIVFLYRDKLSDFRKISESRRYPIVFFNFIEEQVQENIFFKSLLLEPEDNKVFLEGEAKNFEDLAEQILILKSQESVDNVSLSSIKFGDRGEVVFGLDILFTQDFFTTSTEI